MDNLGSVVCTVARSIEDTVGPNLGGVQVIKLRPIPHYAQAT